MQRETTGAARSKLILLLAAIHKMFLKNTIETDAHNMKLINRRVESGSSKQLRKS